jgi:hypothetical protein
MRHRRHVQQIARQYAEAADLPYQSALQQVQQALNNRFLHGPFDERGRAHAVATMVAHHARMLATPDAENLIESAGSSPIGLTCHFYLEDEDRPCGWSASFILELGFDQEPAPTCFKHNDDEYDDDPFVMHHRITASVPLLGPPERYVVHTTGGTYLATLEPDQGGDRYFSVVAEELAPEEAPDEEAPDEDATVESLDALEQGS